MRVEWEGVEGRVGVWFGIEVGNVCDKVEMGWKW